MALYRRVLFAAAFVVVGMPHAHARTDMSKGTCGAFLASGQANMAAAIMWLRGYHAGKRNVIDVIDRPPADPVTGSPGHFAPGRPAWHTARLCRIRSRGKSSTPSAPD